MGLVIQDHKDGHNCSFSCVNRLLIEGRVSHYMMFCCLQEKTCEESTSFDLTPYDVASAIHVVDRLLVEQAKEASHGDSVTEDINVESLNSGQTAYLSQPLRLHT